MKYKLLSIICFSLTALNGFSQEAVRVIKMEIESFFYSSSSSYGEQKMKAIYIYKNNNFVLIKGTNNSFISKITFRVLPYSMVNHFISNISNMKSDSCSFLRLSYNDINKYKKMVEIGSSKDYDQTNLLYKIDANKYSSIPDDSLINMSCHKIYEALHFPCNLYFMFAHPFRITFYCSNKTVIKLRPYLNYKGVPWVFSNDKESILIDYDFVMSFINDIGFKGFIYENEKEYMILHVVNTLLNH